MEGVDPRHMYYIEVRSVICYAYVFTCPPSDDELNAGSMPLCRRTPGGGCRGLVSNRLQLPTIVRMDSDKS